MIGGVYADPHVTKNMRSFQDIWDTTAKKSIISMYDEFDERNVEFAVCLGDFFDKPLVEAKHMKLVMPILRHINERTYPTYMLLGNHEMDSEYSNILDFLSMYENIIPITELTEIEGMVFIPYGIDPTGIDMKDKIVFTHHDIYGSDLAGGKTKAFFGIDPEIFRDTKLVMNGHVHLRSQVTKNVLNAGSLLVSQQGELRVGDYPQYYILDKSSGNCTYLPNTHSMFYLTANANDVTDIAHEYDYDLDHLVLKVEYSGDTLPEVTGALHVSYRKLVDNIDSKREEIVRSENFDMKNYLIDYIKRDPEVSDARKEEYISTGLELLDS